MTSLAGLDISHWSPAVQSRYRATVRELAARRPPIRTVQEAMIHIGALDIPLGIKNLIRQTARLSGCGPTALVSNSSDSLSGATLKQVVIITRHGARLPLHPFPNNLNWPSESGEVGTKWWGAFKGMLTPAGIQDHVRNGMDLAQHYLDTHNLLYGLDRESVLEQLADGVPASKRGVSPILSELVYARSTNTTRTVMSGWSLLSTMLPKSQIRFQLDEEESQEKWEDDTSTTLDDATVTLNIAAERKNDPTHVYYLRHERYKAMVADMLNRCPRLQGAAAAATATAPDGSPDSNILQLLDKCWEMTACPDVNPSNPVLKRMKGIRKVKQNFSIDAYHNMLALRNKKGLMFTKEEDQILKEWTKWYYELVTCGHSDEDRRLIATYQGNSILQTLVRCMSDYVRGASKARLCVFSNHDIGILCMMAAMNVVGWTFPNFAAYVIFELHQTRAGEWRVRTLFNPEPSQTRVADLQPFAVPLGATAVPLAECMQHGESVGFLELERFSAALKVDRM